MADESGGGQRPESATPWSIQLALFLFCIAIALPILAISSTHGSHDGFEIFGRFLIGMGLAGLAGIIGIICTFIGLARGARGGWTVLAAILAGVSTIVILGMLSSAA
jgi:hypothetical protein